MNCARTAGAAFTELVSDAQRAVLSDAEVESAREPPPREPHPGQSASAARCSLATRAPRDTSPMRALRVGAWIFKLKP